MRKYLLAASTTLVGILVDVSGSMKQNYDTRRQLTDEQVSRAESIFRTVIKIAEQAESRQLGQTRSQLFVLAFGLQKAPTADLLSLLDREKDLFTIKKTSTELSHRPLIDLLAQHGASRASKFIEEYLNEKDAAFLFDYYSANISDLSDVIGELPESCKDSTTGKVLRTSSGLSGFLMPNSINPVKHNERNETKLQAKAAIDSAKANIHAKLLGKAAKVPEPKTFKSTLELLHQLTGSKENSVAFRHDQVQYLVCTIEPFIYGGTAMCEALEMSLKVFSAQKDADTKKILFLLTSGSSTDGDPTQFTQALRSNDIQTFTCLLTSDCLPNPRRLYYQPDSTWSSDQKKLFELSSVLPNSHSALSVLLESGWELPLEGQARLFVQANHPDVVDEFASAVGRLEGSNDVLLNILGRASLTKYINLASSSASKPFDNKADASCYANAVGAVLHLALARIVGRAVPEFKVIRDDLIQKYITNGAVTVNVLSDEVPRYHLRYREVDEQGARRAVNARRPVIATFHLYDSEWSAFMSFYRDTPKGILEKKHLTTVSGGDKTSSSCGHAAVLMEVTPNSLKLMNSWGESWADDGFFSVSNASVLDMRFFDIYWTEDDLTETEKEAYDKRKSLEGEELLKQIPESVKSLPYRCPKCTKPSPAIEFTGNLIEAICPKCSQSFIPVPVGFVLNW